MSLSINSLAPATLELHIGGMLDKQDTASSSPSPKRSWKSTGA